MINTYLFIDEEEYGVRNWEQVPRKGESIKVHGEKEGWYSINDVQWWTVNNDFGESSPRVSLMLTEIPDD